MDETYIKVKGVWCYLYRAVDNYGYTIDFCLREKRDGKAAKGYFQKAIDLYQLLKITDGIIIFYIVKKYMD